MLILLLLESFPDNLSQRKFHENFMKTIHHKILLDSIKLFKHLGNENFPIKSKLRFIWEINYIYNCGFVVYLLS